MAREIICINEDNVSISLKDKFTPWELQSCEGIYESNSPVNTLSDSMTDGSVYQGSKLTQRNIILTLRDRPTGNHMANRALLYTVFKPKTAGTFIYKENGVTRYAKYYVEKLYIDAIKGSRAATISLICPDPYFYDPAEMVVSMGGWIPQFEFPHEFTEDGEEFGIRDQELLKQIVNTNADDIGITLTLMGTGAIVNPVIHHLETQTHVAVGTTAKPFTLLVGEKLIITTHDNNKHIYLLSNNTLTEINEYLSEDSSFIQLQYGLNTFGYSADAGADYLSIDIAYRYQYLGV